MNTEELKDLYRDYDEKTLKYIEFFLEEFDKLYGKYVDRAEVIRRINKNVRGVIYNCKLEGDIRGGYYTHFLSEDFQKILLSEKCEDEECEKHVFFHEMVHAITFDDYGFTEGRAGFQHMYLDKDLKFNKSKGIGLTEAFTQYVENQRCKIVTNNTTKFDSYPVLTDVLEEFIKVVDKDIFFDIAFNNPDKIYDMLGENAKGFIEAYDILYKNEDYIIQTNEKNFIDCNQYLKNTEEDIMIAKYNICKTIIDMAYPTKDHTVYEFEEICNIVQRLSKILNLEINSPIYDYLLEILNEIDQSGKSKNDLINELDEKNKKMMVNKKLLEVKLSECSQLEILEMFKEKSFVDEVLRNGVGEEQYDPNTNSSYNAYIANIVNKVMGNIPKNRCKDVFEAFANGLASIIIDNGWEIDRLGIEFMEMNGQNYISLYNTGRNKREYIETYMLDDDYYKDYYKDYYDGYYDCYEDYDENDDDDYYYEDYDENNDDDYYYEDYDENDVGNDNDEYNNVEKISLGSYILSECSNSNYVWQVIQCIDENNATSNNLILRKDSYGDITKYDKESTDEEEWKEQLNAIRYDTFDEPYEWVAVIQYCESNYEREIKKRQKNTAEDIGKASYSAQIHKCDEAGKIVNQLLVDKDKVNAKE